MSVSLTDDRTLISLTGAVAALTPVAIGEITGSSGAKSNDVGITSSSRSSTGIFSITFDQQVSHVLLTTSVEVGGELIINLGTNLPATTVLVQTRDGSGTYKDPWHSFHVSGVRLMIAEPLLQPSITPPAYALVLRSLQTLEVLGYLPWFETAGWTRDLYGSGVFSLQVHVDDVDAGVVLHPTRNEVQETVLEIQREGRFRVRRRLRHGPAG